MCNPYQEKNLKKKRTQKQRDDIFKDIQSLEYYKHIKVFKEKQRIIFLKESNGFLKM